MPRKNPHVATLESVAKRLAKAKPTKAYELLHEAFMVFAAAGDVPHASAIVRLANDGSLTRPKQIFHALGTGPMDGFCAAAGLGDLTGGEPRAEYLAAAKDLAERLRASEGLVRWSLTRDAYTQFQAPTAEWKTLDGRDLYRKAQILARPATDGTRPETEADALAAFTKYMDAWTDPTDRGFGYGQEVALAFDLALRHGAEESVTRWVPVLGAHLLEWDIHEALCMPRVAKAITGGLLAPLVALPKDQAAALCEGILTAAQALAGAAAAKTSAPEPGAKVAKAPKRERRNVSGEYSQFYLEHASPPEGETYFQDERESAQGFSLFATKVGIATPSETAECGVELALAKGKLAKADLDDAVQAVSFPFRVTGPLFVRSVTGGGDDDDDDVVLPPGAYEVLARFYPKRAGKEDAEAGLRAWRVTLDFYAAGALESPKCFKLEDAKPPKKLFIRP